MGSDSTGLPRSVRGSLVILGACLCVLAPAGAAEALSADEIVKNTEHAAYYLGQDGRAGVTMTITDEQGRERRRRLSILRRDQLSDAEEMGGGIGDQKYFVHISYPPDLKNTVLMVWKHPRGEDDRWLYLPALDLSKRIAASDKRTSFLGSDFFYEDISGRSLDQDVHELVETTDSYYVIKNTPKQPETVEFAHYTMWIHRQTFLPVKAEYTDKQGNKYRVYEALQVETIQGRPTVTKSRMQDLVRKQHSVLEFSRIKYDTGIAEDIFTERYLRNPPRKLLR